MTEQLVQTEKWIKELDKIKLMRYVLLMGALLQLELFGAEALSSKGNSAPNSAPFNKKEYYKQWYGNNIKHIREYRLKNKEKRNKQSNQWYGNNIKHVKEYYKNNFDHIKKIATLYRKNNIEKIRKHQKEYNKLWYQNNLEYHGNYRKNNINYKERHNQWQNNKYRNDINFKLRKLLSHRINSSLKAQKTYKINKSVLLLGCSIESLKRYLESKFKEGMTWENYGKWEIDHIYPCSKFDLLKKEEQKKCYNYRNLQPLWKIDNRKKGGKLIYGN